LLDLKQFQVFIELIKSLSSRVEAEQTRKLQELSGTNGARVKNGNDDFMSFGAPKAFASSNGGFDGDVDFESLVKDNAGASGSSNLMEGGWDSASANATARPSQNVSNQAQAPAFSWSTPSPAAPSASANSMATMRPQQGPASRTITPDLSRFDALTPSATQFSQPLQPQSSFNAPPQLQTQSSYKSPLAPPPNYNTAPLQPQPMSAFQSQPATSVNWGAAASNPWNSSSANPSLSSMAKLGNSMSNMNMNNQPPAVSSQNSFSLPPPPGANAFATPPQQPNYSSAFGVQAQTKPPTQQKSGLDAYESLL
jgi:SCY1-like protein 2